MNDDLALLARLLTAGAPNSVQPSGSMFPPVSGQSGMGMLSRALLGQTSFNPRAPEYDYRSALAAGMGPDGTGQNAGHWGSVAPASDADKSRHGLPPESYMMLKGQSHPTFGLGLQGERERGFDVIERGGRFYSVPR